MARMALDIGSSHPTNPHKSTNCVKESETLAAKNVMDSSIDRSESPRQTTATILSFRNLSKLVRSMPAGVLY